MDESPITSVEMDRSIGEVESIGVIFQQISTSDDNLSPLSDDPGVAENIQLKEAHVEDRIANANLQENQNQFLDTEMDRSISELDDENSSFFYHPLSPDNVINKVRELGKEKTSLVCEADKDENFIQPNDFERNAQKDMETFEEIQKERQTWIPSKENGNYDILNSNLSARGEEFCCSEAIEVEYQNCTTSQENLYFGHLLSGTPTLPPQEIKVGKLEDSFDQCGSGCDSHFQVGQLSDVAMECAKTDDDLDSTEIRSSTSRESISKQFSRPSFSSDKFPDLQSPNEAVNDDEIQTIDSTLGSDGIFRAKESAKQYNKASGENKDFKKPNVETSLLTIDCLPNCKTFTEEVEESESKSKPTSEAVKFGLNLPAGDTFDGSEYDQSLHPDPNGCFKSIDTETGGSNLEKTKQTSTEENYNFEDLDSGTPTLAGFDFSFETEGQTQVWCYQMGNDLFTFHTISL